MSRTNKASGTIDYVVGDATLPAGGGPAVIAHVCNDVGRWGRGFVLPLGERYPRAKEQFLAWHRGEADDAPAFELGRVQFVAAGGGLWVANVIGQHGLTPKAGVPPIRYEAVRAGLAEVARFAKEHGATVHMPRIGCGLAGGTWERIEPIVARTLGAAGVDTVVYDLAKKAKRSTAPRGRRTAARGG